MHYYALEVGDSIISRPNKSFMVSSWLGLEPNKNFMLSDDEVLGLIKVCLEHNKTFIMHALDDFY